MQVKGLRVETILAILHSRGEHGLFYSLEDFLARIPAERDEIEALIKCGAFDGVCALTRPAMLWQWNLLQAKGHHGHARPRAVRSTALKDTEKAASSPALRDHNDKSTAFSDYGSGAGSSALPVLFAEMEHDDSIAMALREIHTDDYTPEQKLRYEREILEVCVSGHPLDFLPRNGEAWSDELPKLHGKRVTLCGWVVTYRHVGTKNYRNMMFITLEDKRGLFEVILFPDVYDKYGGLVYETRAMRVTGFVQDGETVNGESLEKLHASR